MVMSSTWWLSKARLLASPTAALLRFTAALSFRAIARSKSEARTEITDGGAIVVDSSSSHGKLYRSARSLLGETGFRRDMRPAEEDAGDVVCGGVREEGRAEGGRHEEGEGKAGNIVDSDTVVGRRRQKDGNEAIGTPSRAVRASVGLEDHVDWIYAL
ncbi:hypothetical protein BHM03_00052547 [Ensete ventricosum]|nr:hypothetical protein BHM03_00052547 [Ensete ventricosum]